MTPTTTHPAPAAHKGLLRGLGDVDSAQAVIDSWFRSAVDRGQQVCTVGSLPHPGAATGTAAAVVNALTPGDLHPSSMPERLVRRALADGFQGLGVLIHADELIADTSSRFHDAVETTLTDLCVEHPVRVLCVYDRPGVGSDCLDLAVTQHLGDLCEPQLTFHATGDAVHVVGEVDMTNLDVFETALRAAPVTEGRPLRIDLSGVSFLSAGAAHALHRRVAVLRQGGVQVELHGATGPVTRALRLVDLHHRPQS